MTRSEFNRRFAATDDNMNYSAGEGEEWSAEDIARLNDYVFSQVAEMDADDPWAADSVKGYSDKWVNSYPDTPSD